MGDGIENETEGESLTKRERGSGPDTHTQTLIQSETEIVWGAEEGVRELRYALSLSSYITFIDLPNAVSLVTGRECLKPDLTNGKKTYLC